MTVHGRVWQPNVKNPRIANWQLKIAMAITGLIMVAFVFVHMLGNLKIFSSHESINTYSQWLREAFMPLLPYEGLLWIARIVLGACLLIHVVAAFMVWSRSRSNQGSAKPRHSKGWFAKLMLPTGLVLLVFIVLHLLDLTIGKLVAPEGFRHPDPEFHAATNLIASLDRPVMAGFYLFMLLALAIHFAHGIELAINDLGTTSEKGRNVARIIGMIVALLVLVGDAMVVLSANLGVV
ncbi:MAG: succinate dehydrogenase cytochrome b subunit [Acidobacteriota bacterium]|nr:succinate dehydrogenase cytochrome b subunit [Acidobacteriota bacterium]